MRIVYFNVYWLPRIIANKSYPNASSGSVYKLGNYQGVRWEFVSHVVLLSVFGWIEPNPEVGV